MDHHWLRKPGLLCAAVVTTFLLRNTRTTDSPEAAKSAEFLFRLVPRPAACALLSGKPGAMKSESVRRIFVSDFGNKPEAAEVRRDLISELGKKGFKIVNSAKEADAILSGDVEVFVKEYYSLYVRAGTSPDNGKPIYGGYVSVELKAASGETLWSYLAATRTGAKDAPRYLSKEIAKHLTEGLSSPDAKGHSSKE